MPPRLEHNDAASSESSQLTICMLRRSIPRGGRPMATVLSFPVKRAGSYGFQPLITRRGLGLRLPIQPRQFAGSAHGWRFRCVELRTRDRFCSSPLPHRRNSSIAVTHGGLRGLVINTVPLAPRSRSLALQPTQAPFTMTNRTAAEVEAPTHHERTAYRRP